MQLAMIQDELMPVDAVPKAYLDRAMYYGDGVYEVLRSYKGRIFALKDHFIRFTKSLEAVGIQGIAIETVKQRVLLAFERAGIDNAKIYFHVTRGSCPRDQVDTTGLTPNFYLTITELETVDSEKSEGISVMTHPDLRWKRCDIKSLNLLPNVLAKREACKKGCSEAILVDDKGLITEGSGSAFFGVCYDPSALGPWSGLCLRTTALGLNILPSVTRKYVIKSAKAIGLHVVEQSMAVEEAKSSQELFIAVTTCDIVPVVLFDGHSVGHGKPGKATQALIQAFQGFVEVDSV